MQSPAFFLWVGGLGLILSQREVDALPTAFRGTLHLVMAVRERRGRAYETEGMPPYLPFTEPLSRYSRHTLSYRVPRIWIAKE